MSEEGSLETWKELSSGDRVRIWENDAVLKYFVPSMLQEFVDGKPTAFSMEQIFEVQNRLEVEQKAGISTQDAELANQVSSIFGPKGVKSKVARSHKLNKVIQARMLELVANGKPQPPPQPEPLPIQQQNENQQPNQNQISSHQPTTKQQTPSTTQQQPLTTHQAALANQQQSSAIQQAGQCFVFSRTMVSEYM